MMPLLRLQDEHVLATLSAVVLALCEGRTGLPISGVFGPGKTQSAAVLLAGLLVFEPDLKLMVLTKENVASHAFAEHLVALALPDSIQCRMGRLTGYYERRRKGAGTPIDVPIENRNQIVRQKTLLIGCGGTWQSSDTCSLCYPLDGGERRRHSQYACYYICWSCRTWREAAMGLVLSSSARVSQVTYHTVVGVRYPELVEQTSTGWRFGRFVSEEEPLRGGSLPVFWDVPRARMHAVGDI